MSTLHIAWIKTVGPDSFRCPQGFISDLISSELVTVSGTSAQSAVAPTGATHAIVTAVDANTYVTKGASSPTAAATNSVCVMTPGFHVVPVAAGQKIAGKTF